MRIDSAQGISSNYSHAMTGASSYSAAAGMYQQASGTSKGGNNSVSLDQLVQLLSSPDRSGPIASDGKLLSPPMSASDLFSQLKQGDDGTVSKQDFISGMAKLIRGWSGDQSSAAGSQNSTLKSNIASLAQQSFASEAGSIDTWA